MNLTPSTVERLRGPFWYGYWVGRFQALRNHWLSMARATYDNKGLRSQYVSYARGYNKDLISAKKRIKDRRPTR